MKSIHDKLTDHLYGGTVFGGRLCVAMEKKFGHKYETHWALFGDGLFHTGRADNSKMTKAEREFAAAFELGHLAAAKAALEIVPEKARK